MVRDHDTLPHGSRSDNAGGDYVLIVRGLDGRPRVERFNDAAAYRARLVALEPSNDGSLSIEEIVGWLDA